MAEVRQRYTDNEDKLVMSLYKAGWCAWEIGYRLFEGFGTKRSSSSVGQRLCQLRANGALEVRPQSISSITQEAIDWAKKHFNLEIEPSRQLQLVELHPKQKQAKRRRKPSKTKAREVLKLAKKHKDETSPSYTAYLLRTQRESPGILDLFKSLLEAAMDEQKTALHILDDLRIARS